MMRFVVIGVGVLASLVGGYFIQKAVTPLIGGGDEITDSVIFNSATRLKKPRRSRIDEPSEDGDRALYQPGGPA